MDSTRKSTHQLFEVIPEGIALWQFLSIVALLVLAFGYWAQNMVLLGLAMLPVIVGRALGKADIRLFARREPVAVGVDGLRVHHRFIPWRDTREIRAKGDRVTIDLSRGRVRVRLRNASAFVQYATGERDEYEERVPPEPIPELEPVPGESVEQRVERVADAARRGAAYRQGALNAEKLRMLSLDPTSPPEERIVAARVLVRVAPDLARPVRAALSAMVDTEFREKLEEALEAE